MRTQALKNPETAPADFALINSGSLYLFVPLSVAAQDWLAEHCPSGLEHTYLGPNLAVEHRYIQDLVDHAVADGLQPRLKHS